MNIDPREPKLPKWAQEELRELRMALTRSQLLCAELREEIPETNTYVVDYANGDRPLPPHSRIVFHLAATERRRFRGTVSAFAERGALTIRADDAIVVSPQASNAVRIQFEERR